MERGEWVHAGVKSSGVCIRRVRNCMYVANQCPIVSWDRDLWRGVRKKLIIDCCEAKKNGSGETKIKKVQSLPDGKFLSLLPVCGDGLWFQKRNVCASRVCVFFFSYPRLLSLRFFMYVYVLLPARPPISCVARWEEKTTHFANPFLLCPAYAYVDFNVRVYLLLLLLNAPLSTS